MINSIQNAPAKYSAAVTATKQEAKVYFQTGIQQHTTKTRDAELIANDLINHFKKSQYDKAQKLILTEVNPDNIVKIMRFYNRWYGNTGRKTNCSIPNKIYNNYDRETAKKLLDHWMNIMSTVAERKQIDIEQERKAYEAAKKSSESGFFGRNRKAAAIEKPLIEIEIKLIRHSKKLEGYY